MQIFSSIKRLFQFDNVPGEFELLETEKGEPSYFGGWPEESRKTGEKQFDIAPEVEENIRRLKQEFRADINGDIIIRRFSLGGEVPATVACIDGMVDGSRINDFILRDGMRPGCMKDAKRPYTTYTAEHVFTVVETKFEKEWGTVKKAILEGRSAIFIEGETEVLVMDTRGYDKRGVESAQNEKVVRGPQEAFNENLRTNITLIRRIVRTDDLVCEMRYTGGDNNTLMAVLYREGTANETLVNEVKRRLAVINTRMVMSTGVIEQLTEKHTLWPLPQILSSERPDRAASFLMEGHVVVLCDGSPYANIMPVTLFALMNSPEDIYVKQPLGTVIRIARYIGAALSILLPGAFLAAAIFHPGLLSTEILSTIIASRKMVFASIGNELIFLMIVFQLVREAGLRVPGSIGQAIGIIGGLILGQAAVAANLVSSVVLILVALTGLGNFCMPDYATQLAASYFRLFFVLSAWIGGLLGLSVALVLTVAWVATIKSYGVPFLSPLAPKTYSKRPLVMRGKINMHQRAADYMNTGSEKRA